MKPQDFTRLTQDENQKWLYKDTTERIIGCAMEVHRILGSGFLEYVYQQSLCYELERSKIRCEAKKELDVWYKDFLIPKKYTPDLIVEDCIIVEIKAISKLTDNNTAQLLNYLKATKKRVGLLLNFGAKSLEIKRKIL